MMPYRSFQNIVHPSGYVFVLFCIMVTFVIHLVVTGSSFPVLGTSLTWLGLITTFGCVYFFRNPDRVTPISEDLIVSPADGLIVSIKQVVAPAELGLGETEVSKVSIFLSVLDVHVNRIPITGKVISLLYTPGKFFNASFDKASIHNERQSIVVEAKDGHKIAFVQIAGLIARRIVCDLEEGAAVEVGKRFGIIRFGSRVDVYLPLQAQILVAERQSCIGGETIIATLGDSTKQELKFEVR